MTRSYFDPNRGYVMPADDHESDTHRSLREVIAELKRGETTTLSDDLYDAVEHLLYNYQIFVRQGVGENIGTQHKNVSWYLTERDDGRPLISYQDGVRAEWLNDCYADEVPLSLLISLFRRIQRRKPLGDQEANETIQSVNDLDAEYVRTKEKLDLEKQLGNLTLGRGEDGTRAGHDTEDDDQ